MNSIIKKFVPFVENQLSHELKLFRLNGGREFGKSPLQSFFDSKGISHQKSCLYTPEQNGITKRKYCHIVETTMSLLFHSFVPLEFWPYAFSTTVFLLIKSSLLHLKCFHHLKCFFGYTPTLHHLNIFGCACYLLLKPYTKHKLQPNIPVPTPSRNTHGMQTQAK